MIVSLSIFSCGCFNPFGSSKSPTRILKAFWQVLTVFLARKKVPKSSVSGNSNRIGCRFGCNPANKSNETHPPPTQKRGQRGKHLRVSLSASPKPLRFGCPAWDLGYMAVGQRPVPVVNIKVGGKWMFIHHKMGSPLVLTHIWTKSSSWEALVDSYFQPKENGSASIARAPGSRRQEERRVGLLGLCLHASPQASQPKLSARKQRGGGE